MSGEALNQKHRRARTIGWSHQQDGSFRPPSPQKTMRIIASIRAAKLPNVAVHHEQGSNHARYAMHLPQLQFAKRQAIPQHPRGTSNAMLSSGS